MNRSHHIHILLHMFVFGILCITLSEQTNEPPPRCMPGLIVDCNLNQEDIVWALDTHQQRCRVFKNRCIYNKNQCYLYKNAQPLLRESTKEECQKLCDIECTSEPKEAVCAKRGDNLCYFKDRCALDKHICNKGETWGIELNRFCDERTTGSTCPESQT